MSELNPDLIGARTHWRLIALIVVTIGLGAAILGHLPGLDGPWYSHWGWRRTPAQFVYPAMLAAALPLFVALWLHDARRLKPAVLLPLIALSHGLFQLVAISLLGAQGFSFDAYIKAVIHPDALSYFADAASLVGGSGTARDWLTHYPELLPQMFLHSKTKPPGPVMFFAAFIATLGLERSTALIAGLAVPVIAMLVSPAVYFFCRALKLQASASFYAAAWCVLSPSAVMFLPSLDVWWMISTCLFLGCWSHALRSNRFGWSIAFGAVLMVTTFFVYNVLVIGASVVAYAFFCAEIPAGRRFMRIARHAAVAIASMLGLYGMLALVTGFNPLVTFMGAYRVQASLPGEFNRVYRWTILFDPLDFALGAGWLTILIVGISMARPHRSENTVLGVSSRCFIWIAVGQIMLTGFSGLLPGEAARVWAFLVPLLMPMVGSELARWSQRERFIAYVCAWLILALLIQNLLAADFEQMPLVGLYHIV